MLAYIKRKGGRQGGREGGGEGGKDVPSTSLSMGRARHTISLSTSLSVRACPSVKVNPNDSSISARECSGGREEEEDEEGREEGGGRVASSGRQGGREHASRSA